MKFLLRFLLCISFSFGYSQAIVINKNNKTVATQVKFCSKDKNMKADCFDIFKTDTIQVNVFRNGLTMHVVKLLIINNKINVKAYIYTDYPAYDGESNIELTIADYKMELNQSTYAKGDTIKGSFIIKTAPHKYQDKLIIKGTIFHVLGGNYFYWDNGISTKNWAFSNGKNVYVKQED